MKKFSKLAFIAASIVVVSSASAKSAPRSVPVSQQAVNDNWANGTGELIWTNGTNELCWRDGFWTPATANAKCDGALVAEAPPAPPVAPTPPAPIASQKVRYQAETLFDFDRAALKPEGKAELDKLVGKLRNVNIEVFVATGHTDRIGTNSYNDRLGWRRAQAVKAYLASKGISPELIYTESKGKREPVKTGCKQSLRKARAALIACLAPNRRVEIEVVGTVIPADLPSRSDPPLSDNETQSQQ